MKVFGDQFEIYKQEAMQLGFSDMAAAEAGCVESADVFRDWVAEGHNAEMEWFKKNLEKRLNPKLILETVQSVLVLLSPYTREPCNLGPYKIARYACGDDYHDHLKKRLKMLCAMMTKDFPQADFRVYVDTGPVAERYWAEQAGLGWIGKNGCMIKGKDGSYFFISCILTNLVFPFSKRHTFHCGTCTACLDHCPTDAFVKPGIVDSGKCISYLNIEHRGDFKASTNLHGWAFGCDICQEVCPWNRKSAGVNVLDLFKPRESFRALSSKVICEMDVPEFRECFRKSSLKRTKLEGLQRNIKCLERHECE